MYDVHTILRILVFATFCLAALVALAGWLVRTRRVSPFGRLGRTLRSVTDPVLRPVEARLGFVARWVPLHPLAPPRIGAHGLAGGADPAALTAGGPDRFQPARGVARAVGATASSAGGPVSAASLVVSRTRASRPTTRRCRPRRSLRPRRRSRTACFPQRPRSFRR